MLERTSACLDTGVRFSLRQKSLFPKSRRLLHSSFWATHAPDVDHLCLYSNLSPPVPAAAAAAPASADSYDASPFLDFLYPAPTQAFMTRLSQWETRSRKHSRPNVLRGYSSLTTRNPSSAAIPPTRAHQELLALLDSPMPDRSFLSLDVERAWNLLSQILEPAPALLCRVIHWFSKTLDKTADRHAADLFSNLPNEFKPPPVYQDAIQSNLRLGRQSLAAALHKEASLLAKEGSIASGHLMASAVNERDWHLAISVLKEWETYNASAPNTLDAADFWNTVVRPLPFVLVRLHDLRRLCYQRTMHEEKDEFTQQLLRLYRLMLGRWIHAQSRNPLFLGKRGFAAAEEVRASVRASIFETHKCGLASAALYENVLMSLLTLPHCAESSVCTLTVRSIYQLYRRSDIYAPTERLLLQTTKFWKEHSLAFSAARSRSDFIGLGKIMEDFYKFHQKPSDEALLTVMNTFAQRGYDEPVREHAYLYKSLHTENDLDADNLSPLLTVHAVNLKPALAAQQLDDMKKEFGVSPNLKCWNIVLQAYTRVDDLPEALQIFRKMLDSGIKPDEYTYTSLLTLYAKRGDVDGVIDLLGLAKSNGVTTLTTHMLNCMILALAQSYEIAGALRALDQTVQAVRQHRANGPLTLCFNTMLTALAWKRDLKGTMAVYHRMKEENVPLDGRSYGALMLVLCLVRQTPAAHKILKSVMPANGIRPLAFHYAILTSGYIGQEMYTEAIEVEDELKLTRVRTTSSARAIARKAKAASEDSMSRDQTDEAGHLPSLDLAIQAFQKVLDDKRIFRHGFQPEPLGFEVMDISNLIHIHGRRRVFEAVQHLFQMYQKKLSEVDAYHNQAPIVILLTNLMFVHSQAEEWSEVDKYWDLIKSRVDEIRTLHIPASKLVQSVRQGQITRSPREAETARIPAYYRFMLSRPLQYYIRSQFAQSSTRKLVPMMTKLFSQGFRFANKTWNELIVRLCQTSPPRALLAFTLVEKYMMKDWPGWIPDQHGAIRNPDVVYLKKQTHKESLQYIGARYINEEQIIPQYRTMVHLAGALLEIRGLTSRGLGDYHREPGIGPSELRKQVGTISEISKEAPRTMHAIHSMPRVVDRLQEILLRT
ncbi:hypothetical protein E4T48_04169 [Aureobasidium sp. EXF-10727]|nr:hypothetical protein E4T48_04169 [Aureobasidium sp. EXF-10727]